MRMRWLSVVAGLSVLAACGGSPTNPSNSGSSGSSGGGSSGGGGSQVLTCPQVLGSATRAQGTMTASINGVAWAADCIAVLTNTPTAIAFSASDLATGTAFQTLGFAGTRAVGAESIAALSLLTATLVQGTSGWNASSAQGSGTRVFTSVTTNSAAGTFTFVLLPVPGAANPATGMKTVTGAFNLTF